ESFPSLCVKLFDPIIIRVKNALNCLCTKKICKPVAELQREPEQFNSSFTFLLRTTRASDLSVRESVRLGSGRRCLSHGPALRSLHQAAPTDTRSPNHKD